MGKHKKNSPNVVKVDLSDSDFGKKKVLPVIVGHLSRDGRRVEQTIHKISTPQQNVVHPPVFNPSPAIDETWDDAWDGAWDYAFHDNGDATAEPNGPEPVCPYFLSFLFTPNTTIRHR